MRPVEVVNPTDPGYEALETAFKHNSARRMNYEHFSQRYNNAAVGAILLSDYPTRTKVANIELTLSRWGLTRGEDFTAAMMEQDAEGNALNDKGQVLAVKKLSETRMNKP